MQHLTVHVDLLLRNGKKFMISQVVMKIDINQVSKKKSISRSNLCEYSDAYIAVKGTITFTNPNNTFD